MKLSEITPLLLTRNEAPNICDTLDRLSWANQILIIDSYSTDETPELLQRYPNVRVLCRAFDHFADQCNFGLEQIDTEWTLSLDADYRCPPGLAVELSQLNTDEQAGFRAAFKYCVFGTPLRSCLYPSRVVLHRTNKAHYVRDGHAHRVVVDGQIGRLNSVLFHDDRKPLSAWYTSQIHYAELESQKLLGTSRSQIGWKDRLRRWYCVAPILTFVYCLFFKRLILDGRAGWHYTMQRVFAEWLLGLTILDRELQSRANDQLLQRSLSPVSRRLD